MDIVNILELLGTYGTPLVITGVFIIFVFRFFNKFLNKFDDGFTTLGEKFDTLTHIVEKQNTNSIDDTKAKQLIWNSLRIMKFEIKNEIERLYKFNHLDEADRQRIIDENFAQLVNIKCKKNINDFQKIFYNSTSLSTIFTTLDFQMFVEKTLDKMFNKYSIEDTFKFIDQFFEDIKEISEDEINKL